MTKGYLEGADILDADDIQVQDVYVPEWGGTVKVRTMEGTERDAFEAASIGAPYKDLRARLAVATVCNADGSLMFTAQDIPRLTRKSSKALDRVFSVSTKLSGLSKEDVEELKKNSSQIPSSDSSTS